MQTPANLLPPAVDVSELADAGRRSIQSRLRHTWATYPEIRNRVSTLIAAGRFPGVRLTGKGAPSLNANNGSLIDLLMLESILASRVRNVIPQSAVDAADSGTDVQVDLDKRQNSAEIFAAMLTLQARSRAAGHSPAFGLTLGDQRTLRYNLSDLPKLIAAMSDTYAEAEEMARLQPTFQLVHAAGARDLAKPGSRVSPQGGYFRYYSNELDLSRYGIYKSAEDAKEAGQYRDSCIINSLQQLGVGEEEMQNALSLVKTRDFPTRALGELATVIGQDIELYYPVKDTTRSGQGRLKKNLYTSKRATTKPPLSLGLYESHYFPYDEETPYSLYFANHYCELVKVCRNRDIPLSTVYRADTIVKGAAYNRHAGKQKLVDSWRLIRGLVSTVGKEDAALRPIPFEDAASVQFADLHRETFESGNYVLQDVSDDEEKRLKIEFKDRKGKVETGLRKVRGKPAIFYADFEASTEEKPDKPLKQHIPYMIGWALHDEQNPVARTAFGVDAEDLVATFLDAIVDTLDQDQPKKEKDNRRVIVYFHNLRYDWSCLIEHVVVRSLIEKDGTLYEAIIVHRGIQIVLRDSYKLIPMPLSGFPEMFGLESVKEVMPHKAFSRHVVRRGLPPRKMATLRSFLSSPEEVFRFEKNVVELGLLTLDDRVDVKKYAEFYCAKDVEVLARGMAKFRQMVLADFDMDVWTYRTISSIAYEYQVREGCFEDCFRVSGLANYFISRSVAGGQNQIANNRPHATDEECVDFDMTSCYPSAQDTIPGYPTGLPKVLTGEELDSLGPETEYPFFVEIEILGRHYDDPAVDLTYPFPPLHDKIDGVMTYTNQPQNRTFVVNNIQLADLVRHYSWIKGEHYVMRRGYRFKGWNSRINTVIREVFQKRLALKKEGNPLQLVYKLILNSSYGKTITKASTRSLRIFRKDKPDVIASFVRNNYSRISHSIPTGKQHLFSVYRPFNEHTSSPQAGSFILAQAKWLMRNVFLHAHAEAVNIHYTDTDSMIVDRADLPKLERFVGKDQLGTFHTDLESGKFEKILGKKAYKTEKERIYSARSVFIGKKTYHLRLAWKNAETGETLFDEHTHARSKGIPASALIYAAEQEGVRLGELYDRVLSGQDVEFDLLLGGRGFSFKYGKDMTVRSISDFKRKINGVKRVEEKRAEEYLAHE